MRYRHWSWHDLMATPQSVVNDIISVMNDEAEQAELNRLLHS